MKAKIGSKVIDTSVEKILNEVRSELTNGKLRRIERRGRNLAIPCPIHKDGRENNPSCYVLNTDSDQEVEEGTAHCFTCGYRARLPQLIADLFDESLTFGEDWLLDRYCNVFIEKEILLPAFDEPTAPPQNEVLSEEILTEYDFYHPYMWKRGLSKEVVDKFRVGYNKVSDSITFPVYDEKKNLVMVTSRSVTSKFFHIPAEVEKPVYLLYDVLERGETTVFVCESQINALYLRSLFPISSIALFGTGSKTQYETLRKSGIRNYILCFDGDVAGRKGAGNFIRALGKSVFVTDIVMPHGKDVNDFTREELVTLFTTNGVPIQ